MPEPPLTVGRFIITLGNLAYALGAFYADFNESHVYNPRWTPHAKFHNGQTMSLGVFLAAASIGLAYQPKITAMSAAQARNNVFWAAVVGSFYTTAGLSAILYPGTDWKDPESTMEGDQRSIFVLIPVLMWVAYGLEVRRLGK